MIVASPNAGTADEKKKIGTVNYTSKLIRVDRPILRIPTLAIHLERGVNEQFKFNNETEFIPILGLISSQLNAAKEKEVKDDDSDHDDKLPGSSSIINNHHPRLLNLLSEELSVAPEEIMDFELYVILMIRFSPQTDFSSRSLYDTQPSVLGGINNEFIFSGRMDNLMSTFCAVEAIIESSSGDSLTRGELEGNVNLIALFNHEEVRIKTYKFKLESSILMLCPRLDPLAPAVQSLLLFQTSYLGSHQPLQNMLVQSPSHF